MLRAMTCVVRYPSLVRSLSRSSCQALAGVWDGESARIFIDGQLASFQNLNRGGGKDTDAPAHLRIGMAKWGGEQTYFFAGSIDELRVSGTVRYKLDFEPPRFGDRFEPDEHTIALYHFDEGKGATLLDSSGNDHHGRIENSRWVQWP